MKRKLALLLTGLLAFSALGFSGFGYSSSLYDYIYGTNAPTAIDANSDGYLVKTGTNQIAYISSSADDSTQANYNGANFDSNTFAVAGTNGLYVTEASSSTIHYIGLLDSGNSGSSIWVQSVGSNSVNDVDAETDLYTANKDGRWFRVDEADGSEVWSYNPSEGTPSDVDVDGSYVYGAVGSTIYKLHRSNGSVVWSKTAPNSVNKLTYGDGNFYTSSGSNLYKYDEDMNQLASNSVGNVNEIDYISNEVFVSDSNGFKDLDTSLNVVDSYNSGETQTELSVNGGYALHNGNGGTAKAFEYQAPLTADIVTDYSNVQPGESIGVDVEVPPDHESGSGNYTLYEQGTDVDSGSLSFDGSYFSATNIYSVKESKNYTVDVQIDSGGSTATDSENFTVPNLPPSINDISIKPNSEPFNESVGVSANVSDATGVDTVNVTVEENGTEIVSSQTLSYNSSSGLYEANEVFTTDELVTYDVTVGATDVEGLYAQDTYSFIPNVQTPTVDNLDVDPPIADSNRLDSWDITADGTVGDFSVDYIHVFFYTIEGTSLTETVNVSAVSNADTKDGTWSINETDLIDVLQSYEGKNVAFELTAYDAEGNSGNTLQETGTVGTYSEPTIGNFTVDPAINQATTEDAFDLSVEGDVGEVPIDNITYSLDVTNNQNPTPRTVEPDFQDQNIYTDSLTNYFEFFESYEGEELTFTVEVVDENGITKTAQISDTTLTPPDGFLQPQPNDGATFLIPEGETNTTVDIEYGVDSSSNSGTAELFLNGNSEDSFSIPANTQDTKTVSLELTENTYNWFVRWTDDNTSETYDSGSKNFEVTDEPISLTLNEPSGDISITNDTTTSLDHVFHIDARAYSGSYYYTFRLTNSDNSNIIADRTSNTKTGGSQNTFTETVSGLGEANYTWRVNVKRSSDDVLLESKNETYTITEDPLFTQKILSPRDGDLLGLDTEEPNRDVNVSYEIDTEGSQVNAELLLNGSQVDTATVGAQDYSVETTTLTDLQEGVWNLTLVGTDGSNREVVSTNLFEIVRTEDEQIEFTEIRTSPPLSEATVGDEIDIYFEGTGNVSDVDYVELEITSDGETVDTIIVPSEDLQSGSWFATVENAFTVTQPLLSTTVRIAGTALANEGYTVSYVYSEILGSERQILATLDRPADGEVFNQTAGDVEPIRFDFDVTTLTDDVNYELQIEYNGSGTFNTVANGTITDNNETVDITRFVNHSEEFIGTQFGDWVYRVKLEETGGITNQKYTSPSREYFIVENLDVVLNLKKPEKNGIYYVDANSDQSTVPFSYDVDTGEAGTITVDINGDQVYEREVNSGYSSEQFTRKLSVGTYDANITFESSNNFESKVNTFSVEEQPDEDEDAFVKLKEPSDGRTLYQGFGNRFSWKVFNPTTDNESDSEEGTTTLYIENEAGDVVETFVREYNTQGEVNVFSELYDTDLNIGTYKFYADFDSNSLSNTITSNERRFTVADFRPPTSTLGEPDNDTYYGRESIEFDWTTTTFEENAEVELKYRDVSEAEPVTLATYDQADANTREYNYSTTEIDKGSYVWFVEATVDGGASFKSEENRFDVETENFTAPEFELFNPEQGDKYEIDGNETDVSFVYDTEVFSDTDATLDLLVQEVVDGGSDYQVKATDLLNSKDGKVSYNKSVALSEGGYRYKLRVEYPNEQIYESGVRSFAVGLDQKVPNAEPKPTAFDTVANFIGGLNNAFKSAVGRNGQYFVATVLILIPAGILQLIFKSRYLTIISTVLLALGFSLVDGYYPTSVFWIIATASAGLIANFGVRALTGSGGD